MKKKESSVKAYLLWERDGNGSAGHYLDFVFRDLEAVEAYIHDQAGVRGCCFRKENMYDLFMPLQGDGYRRISFWLKHVNVGGGDNFEWDGSGKKPVDARGRCQLLCRDNMRNWGPGEILPWLGCGYGAVFENQQKVDAAARRYDLWKLSAEDWLVLLECRYDYSSFFDWEKFDKEDWLRVLESPRPELFQKCDFSWWNFAEDDWVRICRKLPIMSDKCPWELLTARSIKELMREVEGNGAQVEIPWDRIPAQTISQVLNFDPALRAAIPRWMARCDVPSLEGDIVPYLLAECPEVLHLNLDQLSRGALLRLLEREPLLIEQVSETARGRLDAAAWVELLSSPVKEKLRAYCPWDRLKLEDWYNLLRENPEYTTECPEGMRRYNKEQLTHKKYSFYKTLRWYPQLWFVLNPRNLDEEDWKRLMTDVYRDVRNRDVGNKAPWVSECPWTTLSSKTCRRILMDASGRDFLDTCTRRTFELDPNALRDFQKFLAQQGCLDRYQLICDRHVQK